LLKQTQTINSGTTEVIAENTYDELGQLTSKGVGGKTTQSRLQTVDYTYNIRGWLKQINDPNTLGTDLFGFKLGYNEGDNPLFNGNIALTQWKTANTDNSLKTYNYTYDALNRITSGIDNTNNYSLSFVDYDKNGNILHLKRNGQTNTQATSFGVMDDLTYSYNSGNQLLKVADVAIIDSFGFKDDALNTTADTANDYTYDVNGNLKTDANKNITDVQYNYLNLPTQVTINGQNILYVYDATGVKLRKTLNTTTTDYANGFIYENNQLQFFNQPEGYVMPSGSSFNYVYQYKDHLGNIRLSYSDKNNNGVINVTTDPNTTEIIEENNYYPFGLEHKGYNNVVNGTEYNYKTYQGKEKEEDLGLNTLAFGWRDYDPAIARFNKIDRFAEKYRSMNPYQFTANNPIFFREIAGDSINITELYKKNEDGSYVNKSQVKALEEFASTKAGKKYLAKFASKGQKIAGIVFDKDGKYHKKSIDLNIDADLTKVNDTRVGETSVGNNNNGKPDNNNRFQINISLGSDSAYDLLDTLTHEFFIHAVSYAEDIIDNNKVDYSNIDKDIRDVYKPNSRQHYQENRNAINGTSLFGNYGYEILKQGNAKYKRFKSNTEVWNSMWSFIY